jgi:RNA polymerase sigma-70 factor (ECF subfamily)
MPGLSDEELVAACLSGKESAYAVLIERYSPKVYRIAARICRDATDAEDAVQETFIQVVRDLSKWRPLAPLEAWITTITVRVAQKVDMRTSRTIKRSSTLTPGGPEAPEREFADPHVHDPVVQVMAHELQVDLADALAQISTKHRSAVVLRFQEGLSVAEAAAILELPEATVRTHTARGLRELREALGDTSHRADGDQSARTTRDYVGGGLKAPREGDAPTLTDRQMK